MIAGFTGHDAASRRRAGAKAIEYVLRVIAQAVRAQRSRKRPSIAREVEAMIERRFATGLPRVEEVARDLGRSRQTLYRQLKVAGTSFAALLDGVRHRMAVKMVKERTLAVKDIAYRLHFSDPAAFSRAFKRWTGVSPQTARQAGSGYSIPTTS